MNFPKKLTLLFLALSILSSAPASATIWDDAKEFVDNHGKKIAIGAAIVVAAAAVVGAVVGGAIIHNRRQKQVEDGLKGVRDAAALGTNSVAGLDPLKRRVAVLALTHDLDDQKEYVRAFIDIINESHPDLKLRELTDPCEGVDHALIYFTQTKGWAQDNNHGAIASWVNDKSFLVSKGDPKMLIMIQPAEFRIFGKDSTSIAARICPELGNVCNKVFDCTARPSLKNLSKWDHPAEEDYNASQLKVVLGELATTLSNQNAARLKAAFDELAVTLKS
jgi:hypothetical protein